MLLKPVDALSTSVENLCWITLEKGVYSKWKCMGNWQEWKLALMQIKYQRHLMSNEIIWLDLVYVSYAVS